MMTHVMGFRARYYFAQRVPGSDLGLEDLLTWDFGILLSPARSWIPMFGVRGARRNCDSAFGPETASLSAISLRIGVQVLRLCFRR